MSVAAHTVIGVTPNPWAALAARPHVDVVWTSTMPPGMRGATDGLTVWLANGMLQRERRCTLAHELVHMELGHDGCQPPTVEARVRADVARWLLPDIRQVADSLAWSDGHIGMAALDLWVDEITLEHRVSPRFLHPAERHYLIRRLTE